MTTVAICTLFEGDYHFGVAALANSLHRCGFRGTIWAGVRGSCPPWLGGRQDGGLAAVDGVEVRAVPIPPGWHLAHCKPQFMQRVLCELQPDAGGVLYFDPDITCVAPWDFFLRWIAQGVALVDDAAYGRMHRTHPFRAAWKESIERSGLGVAREVDFYVNSGFAGVARPLARFLSTWHAMLEAAAIAGTELAAFKPGNRSDPWFGTDQDALNAAVMASDVPISIVGPDGMGFTPAGFIMYHAIDGPKPWRSRYLLRLLITGTRPDLAHKNFWAHIHGIFSPLRGLRFQWHRCDLFLAIALSRLYQR